MIHTLDLDLLNKKYRTLSVEQRFYNLYEDFDAEDVMCTSSFGSHSAYLLKTLSKVAPDQIVYFIDTGNHFDETHHYRQNLTNLLGLNTQIISASSDIHQYTKKHKTWEHNPTFCCYLKKIRPTETLLETHKIWMSGLMEWQSDHRSTLNFFEVRRGALKFYPLLDRSLSDYNSFIESFEIPRHALFDCGYQSIGCAPCTNQGADRGGRWKGSKKTECGLHL